jgi:hypothetical protein
MRRSGTQSAPFPAPILLFLAKTEEDINRHSRKTPSPRALSGSIRPCPVDDGPVKRISGGAGRTKDAGPVQTRANRRRHRGARMALMRRGQQRGWCPRTRRLAVPDPPAL